ncbi:MAG: Gx transporter family protein [Clostridia bacterium]|nr:Gx transporter family protein [Clostridia bacterium]
MRKSSKVPTAGIARMGMLTALALALGYVEAQLPFLPGLPGVKLGIANTVLLYVLMLDGGKAAFGVMLTRVTLAGLLYAGFNGFCYSLVGGLFSLCVMIFLRRVGRVSLVGMSCGGAAAHNLGQLCVACIWIGHRAALAYAPILLLSGIFTGALTAICAGMILRALGKKG